LARTRRPPSCMLSSVVLTPSLPRVVTSSRNDALSDLCCLTGAVIPAPLLRHLSISRCEQDLLVPMLNENDNGGDQRFLAYRRPEHDSPFCARRTLLYFLITRILFTSFRHYHREYYMLKFTGFRVQRYKCRRIKIVILHPNVSLLMYGTKCSLEPLEELRVDIYLCRYPI